MSTTSAPAAQSTRRIDPLHPLIAAIVAAACYAAALVSGEVFDLNADTADASGTSWGEVGAYAGMAVAAMALATWLGLRARSGPPQRLARYALGLALASAVTYVAFWSGWPVIFGAVAGVTSLEHRRRIGGFGALTATAAALAALALVASLVSCVIG